MITTLQGEHQHRDELTFGVALSSQSEYEADLNIKLMAQRKNRIATIVGLGKKISDFLMIELIGGVCM